MGAGVLERPFTRREGALFCEGVSLEAIAAQAGTPAYVYSANAMRTRYRALDAALADVPHRIHFSLKANSSRGLLLVLRAEGCRADVVSGGELMRALRAGFPPDDIIFGGVGKRRDEIRAALSAGVLLLNVESAAELAMIDEEARALDTVARIAFRVNPEVHVANAHEFIATGSRGHKFGIPWGDVPAVAEQALRSRHVQLVGLDMHVGSQLLSLAPYADGVARLAELARQLQGMGAPLRFFDAGGGLPARYDAEETPDLARFARIVVPVVQSLGLELIVEPGRFVVAESGALLTRVLYRKPSGGTDFVICDAGMSELLRPSHYDAYHRIEAVRPRGGSATVDVVGPICETGDFLARDRTMDDAQPGDLLAVHTVGAYGYVMALTYNTRPRAPEVLVDGTRWAVITRRETLDDLVRLEAESPEWMEG
ncbi:MAG: diaminopimelate decarboxylase [Gemmatimonadaceae bacterium]|nr:diaminopimelate decarboxylase [Gemmatimonadaceae bacterium]